MSDGFDLEYSELDAKWAVDQHERILTSQPEENLSDLRLVFSEPFRDGTISSEITIRESHGGSMDAAFIFRYRDPANYYNAGLGGYGNKFFIGKLEKGAGQAIAASGNSRSIEIGVPYKLSIRCTGNRITLAHNGVTHLSILDNSFAAGYWGLHAYKGKVDFKNPSAETVKPTCFVIMPFRARLDVIYQVIEETVRLHGFDCVRADRRYFSGPIVDDVMEQIERSDLIIADLSGKNPNVFYEAGYANALHKPVIQIAQSVSDLPFDVRHLRTFSYNLNILGDRKLSYDLSEAIKATTGYIKISGK